MAKDDKKRRAKDDELRLGALSERWESNGGGPGTVSPGKKGDPGGISYGTYQFSSQVTAENGRVTKGGTVQTFLKSPEGERWSTEFKHKPGEPGFGTKWKEIAAREPEAFSKAQYDFTKRTHYDPFEAQVQRESGLDFAGRSNALKEVLWSTGVQHRIYTADIFSKAIENTKKSTGLEVNKLPDQAIIEAVYAERFKVTKDGKFARFTKAGKDQYAGLVNRARDEPQAALRMLEDELGTKGATKSNSKQRMDRLKASPEGAEAAKKAIGFQVVEKVVTGTIDVESVKATLEGSQSAKKRLENAIRPTPTDDIANLTKVGKEKGKKKKDDALDIGGGPGPGLQR